VDVVLLGGLSSEGSKNKRLDKCTHGLAGYRQLSSDLNTQRENLKAYKINKKYYGAGDPVP